MACYLYPKGSSPDLWTLTQDSGVLSQYLPASASGWPWAADRVLRARSGRSRSPSAITTLHTRTSSVWLSLCALPLHEARELSARSAGIKSFLISGKRAGETRERRQQPQAAFQRICAEEIRVASSLSALLTWTCRHARLQAGQLGWMDDSKHWRTGIALARNALRAGLVPRKFCKSFQILFHIESLDTCIKH
jgi:hypothetical protein